jgi:hypothetical protein
VFGHLKNDKRETPDPIDVNQAQVITWDKFNWTVLPNAERLEVYAEYGKSGFFAFVTASNPEAPPILQWDSETNRNPVSWYLYHGGSQPSHWNLAAGEFHEVTAVTLQPSGWTSEKAATHQGDGAYLIVRGCRDTSPDRAGLGLFPEILRSEYHSIRAAMEAYSRSRKLSGEEEASACGMALQKSSASWNQLVRVTVAGARVLYRLDRWD